MFRLPALPGPSVACSGSRPPVVFRRVPARSGVPATRQATSLDLTHLVKRGHHTPGHLTPGVTLDTWGSHFQHLGVTPATENALGIRVN